MGDSAEIGGGLAENGALGLGGAHRLFAWPPPPFPNAKSGALAFLFLSPKTGWPFSFGGARLSIPSFRLALKEEKAMGSLAWLLPAQIFELVPRMVGITRVGRAGTPCRGQAAAPKGEGRGGGSEHPV